jgi:peroxiredoxin
MKSIFLTAFLSMVVYGVFAQSAPEKAFTVSGNTSKVPEAIHQVFLMYAMNGERVLDSAIVKNGQYQFSGKLAEPVIARVRAAYPADANGKKPPVNSKKDIAVVFLQAGKILVNHADSFANATITGSASHDAYMKLDSQLKSHNAKMQELSNSYSALYKIKDTAGMKKMEPRFDEVQAEIKKEYLSYIKANPTSPIAVYVVSQYAGWDINPEEVEPVFNSLPATSRNFPSAKLLQEKIELAKKTGVGRYAMEFTQNDTLGKPVSLSSFKGKYVLIDFWASWCGPCRAENPNVVNAFNKYKDKGFHVLGISLDQPNAKDKWIKAIHDDNLTWTHVSDLLFWKNAVAVQYGIQAIPQNFLLDPEGKIIAKNLRGEALQEKLDTLFNKP